MSEEPPVPNEGLLSDKPTAEQRILVGQQAKALVDGPLFNSLCASMIKGYMATLLNSEPGSKEGLSAHMKIRALDELKTELRVLSNDGIKASKDTRNKS